MFNSYIMLHPLFPTAHLKLPEASSRLISPPIITKKWSLHRSGLHDSKGLQIRLPVVEGGLEGDFMGATYVGYEGFPARHGGSAIA